MVIKLLGKNINNIGANTKTLGSGKGVLPKSLRDS